MASRTRSGVGPRRAARRAPRCGGRDGCRRRSSCTRPAAAGARRSARARRRAAGRARAARGGGRARASAARGSAPRRARGGRGRGGRRAGRSPRPGARPRMLPSPRISRSSSARRKPSLVWVRASSRRAPSSVAGSPNSRHRPGSSPRPTRPRSWWSWARPKRSAPSTTIDGRVRDVDAHLDDGRRHQQVGAALGEARHRGALLLAAAGRRGRGPRVKSANGPAPAGARPRVVAARASAASPSSTSGQMTYAWRPARSSARTSLVGLLAVVLAHPARLDRRAARRAGRGSSRPSGRRRPSGPACAGSAWRSCRAGGPRPPARPPPRPARRAPGAARRRSGAARRPPPGPRRCERDALATGAPGCPRRPAPCRCAAPSAAAPARRAGRARSGAAASGRPAPAARRGCAGAARRASRWAPAGPPARPASTAWQIARAATTVLPEPDLALQQAPHRARRAPGRGRSRATARRCSAGEAERQRREQGPRALPRRPQARRRPRALLAPAHRQQPELQHDQLLQHQPAAPEARLGARAREVHRHQRVGGAGDPQAHADPRRQALGRRARQRPRQVDQLADAAGRELLGGRVDRHQPLGVDALRRRAPEHLVGAHGHLAAPRPPRPGRAAAARRPGAGSGPGAPG